ncbi:class I SAM-dependent methyltransferase [Thiolinea disciformis]|uniref:class I SAM-dependent methyltransferase n=1 Tax=Thiolinea disciformis TaxID=125614 RepID=UPI0003806FB9|nr:class I SAM-dependent methyltransferase [Thiolinea disciformis]
MNRKSRLTKNIQLTSNILKYLTNENNGFQFQNYIKIAANKLAIFGYNKIELDSVFYKNIFLPKKRSNQGLNDNDLYIESTKEQIGLIKEFYEFNESSKILDFGCGQGRFVNGLNFYHIDFLSYIGLDIDIYSIAWCEKWLANEKVNFIYWPAYNARYNTNAEKIEKLPFKNNFFDLIFLNSVFSHMLTNDIIFYLRDFRKKIQSNGIIYLTAFIENDVSNCEENPDNYLGSLPDHNKVLLRVRYNKNYIFDIFEQSGFTIKFWS